MFEVFLKSQIMCAKIRTFQEEEIFSLEILKSSEVQISIINIELYCDGNYPRGISILYLVDGQKSIQLNYIESTSEVFRKDSLALNQNEYVCQIDMWKHKNILQKVEI